MVPTQAQTTARSSTPPRDRVQARGPDDSPDSPEGEARRCAYTVVIPIYNEQDTLPELTSRLLDVMDGMGRSFEVIFVNDGSSDRSLDLLRDLASRRPEIKVVSFSRNFGHQTALFAGLCRAKGRGVVMMDGDLQDPPEVIPRLSERWDEGYDVVYAVRQSRKEGWTKRLAYAVYYRLLNRLASISIPLDAGDFSLIDRRVVDLLCQMPERNKFLRGLRSWLGFQQTSVPYERHARYAGKPKYTTVKLFRLAFDGLVSYSYAPLRISYVFGLIVSAFSFVLGGIYLIQKLLTDRYIPQGFTTLAILILFLGGIQLIVTGIMGEYIGRIYDEVKRRPEYIEGEVIGFEDEDQVAPTEEWAVSRS